MLKRDRARHRAGSAWLKQKANCCAYRPVMAAPLCSGTSPEAPVLCAMEISKELKKHPELTGPDGHSQRPG